VTRGDWDNVAGPTRSVCLTKPPGSSSSSSFRRASLRLQVRLHRRLDPLPDFGFAPGTRVCDSVVMWEDDLRADEFLSCSVDLDAELGDPHGRASKSFGFHLRSVWTGVWEVWGVWGFSIWSAVTPPRPPTPLRQRVG